MNEDVSLYPKVSIVIPFYNDAYIDQSIVSALSQTYPRIEVIVVDDGSTLHQDKIRPFLTRVHYLGKANGGTASALNYGIRVATGDYIAWLSSDDMFYPDKIERQLQYMLSQHSAISFTAFDEIDAYNNITGRQVGPQYTTYPDFVRSFTGCCPINGCTVMMKKELLSFIGLFDEGMPYTHDYDLWIRMLLGRVPIHYLAMPLTMYRWHGEMGTKKHWPQVLGEIGQIQAKYSHRLLQYVYEIGG
ncbi:glycosyltransferase [Paenibacillus sp. HWE-109]|uniref:glycosyltransferase n=1 Tax=Paenibacillus sp. HWE-109 TaxID=1306526 RepID=UPI001EDD7426|nr:glycosyltransferase [Paenibacillus sp. HWE-109]UKS27628.1 glycosyltransferase [Paenibacillus sp. HWE-109]